MVVEEGEAIPALAVGLRLIRSAMIDQQPILTIPKTTTAPIGDSTRRIRKVGLALTVVAMLTVLFSFAVLTGMTRIVPSDTVVWSMLVVNGTLLITLGGLLVWELVGLWTAWRAGRAARPARPSP